ncbi:glycoside hydrolase superfamily [Phakopsora pachyrhizi]|uniref:Glycoside hydrolase superfamily n=1 Tax=Phakopsora pachyrhizi TaxID=170000 RepID=A0AAV0ANY7_PHAPC|nr:glycoside hydrolase superfamily [Phakopsora pachyrhizi]CAH7669749.1 glycoside hydrolase superfamily [Phakopsora pachyrhizi]
MVATYYPDWNVNVLPPQSVQYKKYDLIYFAFALPTEYAGLEFTQSDSVQTLKRLVKYAHGNGTKVVLSVGGWSGSKYFSQVIVNETTRSIFANSIYEVVTTNNLDGVDIDWEYPGQAQVQDNTVSPQDTEALLKFFLTLRSRLGAHSIISAAVTDSTFLDKSGKRTTNVSGFGEVLDYILIMNYDVNSESATPGPNAPFSDACKDSRQPGANMISSIKTWTDAGFPREKILMGLPAYGYINKSTATTLVHKRKRSIRTRFQMYSENIGKRALNLIQGQCSDSPTSCNSPTASTEENQAGSETPPITNISSPAANNDSQITNPIPTTNITQSSNSSQSVLALNSTDSLIGLDRSSKLSNDSKENGNLDGYPGPQIPFKDLFKWGVLGSGLNDNNANLTGLNGYKIAWDHCSSTPYAYDKSRNTLVTYDDGRSIGIKARFAKTSGIGGVGFWEITGDHQSMLIDSVWKNFGGDS